MQTAEDRLVAFVAREWDEGLRITTVPQAMSRLGIADDEEVRWRAGRRLERAWKRRLAVHRLWRGLRWIRAEGTRRGTWLSRILRLSSMARDARAWNPATYVLSNDEKLIARYILGAGGVPPAVRIADALHLDPATVATGLSMLARLGFLAKDDGGHRLASAHPRLLEGLGFSFHTVTLEGGEQFNVP